MHYRPGGEVLRVDVDTLNESLKHKGALRLRHSMRPDEAFGMIFSFDAVIADTTSARQMAWAALAQRHGRRLPSMLLARPELLRSSPEYVLVNVLRWASSQKEAQALAWELSELSSEALGELHAPLRGAREWLDALTSFKVPCALVSGLDRCAGSKSAAAAARGKGGGMGPVVARMAFFQTAVEI